MTNKHRSLSVLLIKIHLQIEGMAGERMLEAGCVQLWDKNLANVMGFSEVLKKLPHYQLPVLNVPE
jgi:lipid A disaccharide synthetase